MLLFDGRSRISLQTALVYLGLYFGVLSLLLQLHEVTLYALSVQFDEQKDQVAVEQILRVVFLDPERPSPVSINNVNNHGIKFICALGTCIFFCFTRMPYKLMELRVMLFLQAMEKLKRQLADADAALEARKKPPEDAGPRIIGEGLVIDEWVSYQVLHCPTSPCEYLCTMPNLCVFILYRKSEGKDTLLGSRLKE